MRFFIALSLLLITTLIFAGVYVKQDTKGNLTYSDTPEQGSKAIAIPDVSGTTSVQITSSPFVSKADEQLAVAMEQDYKQFRISSPKEQENIQNQPAVTVNLEVDPDLRQGNKIQLFVDGKPWGEAMTATSMSVPLQERGQHTISAAIVNANQQIIKQSQTVTFFVHRNSVLTSPTNRGPSP